VFLSRVEPMFGFIWARDATITRSKAADVSWSHRTWVAGLLDVTSLSFESALAWDGSLSHSSAVCFQKHERWCRDLPRSDILLQWLSSLSSVAGPRMLSVGAILWKWSYLCCSSLTAFSSTDRQKGMHCSCRPRFVSV